MIGISSGRVAAYGLATLLSALLWTTSPVAAHVLKTDTGISAVLHIPPEDNPVAAQPTNLVFAFGTQQSSFDLRDCRCQVRVEKEGKPIQSTSLISTFRSNAAATVRFPTIGVYTIYLDGESRSKRFQSFHLAYVQRVETSANGPAQLDNRSNVVVLLVSLTSFIILGMFAYRFTDYSKK